MKRKLRQSAAVLVFCLAAGIVVSQDSPARPEFDLGVQAYRHAKYEEAIRHFEQAVERDPGFWSAHLYLATALAQQYLPGVEEAGNLRTAERALGEYKKVLEQDASQRYALLGIAHLCLQMKKFEDAKDYYNKAIELDPNDPESYYSIAVIDWTETYEPRMKIRAKLKLGPEQPLIHSAQCLEVRQANADRVQEGIDMLVHALQLRPDYDDAMAYMNLLYREKADMQCGDPQAYAEDLKVADQWVDLTMGAKEVKKKQFSPEQKPSDAKPEKP